MPPLTRGPLPAGVYWRRRVFVLALAASLVFVIANLLGGGSDGDSEDAPVAQQAAGQVEPSGTVTVSEQPKRGDKGRKNRAVRGPTQGPTYDPSVLVEPEGNCDPADVRVIPQVETTDAGDPVTVGLSLQTLESEACYWRVGPDKVTLKITDGGTEIWTSRECSDAVPDESVVVRRVVATVVEMTWDGRESDEECSKHREWVRWGDYTVAAAALGGEPSETTFELTKPAPETVTVTPDPDGKKGEDGEQGSSEETSAGSSDWESEDAQGDGGDDRPGR